MSKYSEKLKDPRWQKKRLEILERDKWTCQLCFDKESTLMVHHLNYNKGKNPWDYPNSGLTTLCQECHQEEHEFRYGQEQALLGALRINGFFSEDLNLLAIAFYEIKDGYLPAVTASALYQTLRDEKLYKEMMDNYFISLKKEEKNG